MASNHEYRRNRVFHALLSSAVLCAPAAIAQSEAGTAPTGKIKQLKEVVVESHLLREGEISKSDVPLVETPQAISIVTADFIDDRGLDDLNDALRIVAGVGRSSTYGYYDAYTIRGYDTVYDSLYMDGLVSKSVLGTNNELQGLERIEVLKGPASSLYGAAPIGGVVNLVSKRPKPANFVKARVATGSYDLFEGAVDANGRLDSTGDVLARVNVLYRDEDSFVDNAEKNRRYVAPTLTWNISDATQLTLLAKWQKDEDNPTAPLPAEGTVLPNANGDIPYDFSLNLGNRKAKLDQEYTSGGWVFDHAFNDIVSFSQTVRYTDGEESMKDWLFPDAFADSDYVDGVQQGHVLALNYFGPSAFSEDTFGADNRASFKFDTGAISHTALVGYDFRRSKGRQVNDGNYIGDEDYGGVVPTALLDYLNPSNLNPDYYLGLMPEPEVNFNIIESKGKQQGYYFQDHIGFGEKFFVTAGGRWDFLDTDGHKDHAFSPRVGINYLFTPTASVYASWSKSFAPQFDWLRAADGSFLPNGEGKNYEIGVKLRDPQSTLTGAAAIFELTRTNVATDDVLNPGYYIVKGEQRSRGFELEGSWKLVSELELMLAYTYIDAEVTEDNTIPEGTRLGNVPEHNLYVTGEYKFLRGDLAGFAADVSVLWNSDRVADTSYFTDVDGDGDNDADFELPSYTVVDVGVSYKVDSYKFRLSGDNLLDKEYFPEAGGFSRVAVGEPRTWRLSARKQF